MDALAQNTQFYRRRFDDGYGHHHPESHVIKLYNRVLKGRLGITGAAGESLLDFGCSTGINAMYFDTLGFDVYGVDISETAIARCRRSAPHLEDHFAVIDPKPQSSRVYFTNAFDVVFSNQVLALFSETDFASATESLHRALKPGGVFIASIAGTGHYYHARSEPATAGLRKVTPGDDPQDVLFMRFAESQQQVIDLFGGFEPLAVGYYDINLIGDSGFHYVFIGRRN